MRKSCLDDEKKHEKKMKKASRSPQKTIFSLCNNGVITIRNILFLSAATE